MLKLKKILKEKLFKQIIFSFGFRAITPFIMLVTTPILFNNLGVEDYGGWSLLITTIGWLTICDFGLSNQIRNETKILILNNKLLEIRGIFTTAVLLTTIFTVIFTLGISFLKVPDNYKVFLSFIFFLIVQVNICRAVFFSMGKPELSIAITNVPNVFILFFVLIDNKFTINDIMMVYATGTVVMFMISYTVIFRNGTGLYLSSLKKREFTRILKEYSILKGGGGFFLVQIVSMGLVLSDRYILSLLYGNASVSKYDIIFKIANFCIMFFSIINTVLWSRFTELWSTNQFKAIKKIFLVFDFLSIIIVVVLSLVLFNLDYILKWWLGTDEVKFSASYIIGVIIYLLGYYLMSAYSSFLNGIGMITIQFIIQLIVFILKGIICILIFNTILGQVETSYIIWGGMCLCLTGLIFRERAYAKINNQLDIQNKVIHM